MAKAGVFDALFGNPEVRAEQRVVQEG